MATCKKVRLKSGEVRYRYWIRRNGVTVSRRFATKKSGEKWAREIETAIIDGSYRTESSLRVSELINKYLKEVVARWESRAQRERELLLRERLRKRAGLRRTRLGWWYRFLGRLRLDKLEAPMIAKGKQKLLDEGKSPSTVNRYLSALSSVLKWAKHPEQQLIARNPVKDVQRGRESAPLAQPVPFEQIAVLKEAAHKHPNWRLYPALLIGLSDGARKRTIETLRWDQVRLDEALVVFPHHKAGGRAVRAPLTEEAVR